MCLTKCRLFAAAIEPLGGDRYRCFGKLLRCPGNKKGPLGGGPLRSILCWSRAGMAHAIMAHERAGRRIVGSVALRAMCRTIASVSRPRIVTRAIGGRRIVVGCAVVVRCAVIIGCRQRAADNGTA